MSSLVIVISGVFELSLREAIYTRLWNERAYKFQATAESCQHAHLELLRGIPEILDDVIRLPPLRKMICHVASTSWNVYFSTAYSANCLFHSTCHLSSTRCVHSIFFRSSSSSSRPPYMQRCSPSTTAQSLQNSPSSSPACPSMSF